jgi:uncharacterized protein YktB (UPF0637 family)
MKVVEDAGDSANLKKGRLFLPRELRDENSLLKRNDKNMLLSLKLSLQQVLLFYKVLQEHRYKQNHLSLLLLSKKLLKY